MKFDRRSPRAWLTFAATAVSIVLASAMAGILDLVRWPPPRKRRLVLFSHAYAGNVRALVEHAPAEQLASWDVRYLHLDPRLARLHNEPAVPSLLAMNPWQMLWAARAGVVLTTHGPGILRLLMRLRPHLRWADVWHGVPYKEIVYVERLRGVDKLLVASPSLRDFWLARGVAPERLAVVGHPLWDALASIRSAETVLESAQLPRSHKYRVLVAPTWTGDQLGVQRRVFDTEWSLIVERLSEWAQACDAQVVFRSHLNAGDGLKAELPNIKNVPYSQYPITADLLMVSDVLVTDWSAIALDFLPVGRPLVYLDVPPPGRFSFLQASDRPGPCVRSVDELLEALTEAITRPGEHARRYADHRHEVVAKVCGNMADGRASERCLEVLSDLVATP